MKKAIIAFCASTLLFAAAPISNAAYTSDQSERPTHSYINKYKKKQVQYKKVPVQVAAPTKTVSKAETSKVVPTTSVNKAQTSTVAPTTSETKAEASTVSAIEQAVVDETNKARATYGLKPLQIDTALMGAAREKSIDMQKNNYFSHTSPTFGSPFDRLKALNIQYRTAGENIAKGQRSASEVVTAWMNSEGHRANILNESYTHIGVGFVQDGYIWTQQFIQK